MENSVINVEKKRGKLFVVIGPSGAGKTTVVNLFLNRGENSDRFLRVPAYTTRAPREGEKDGVDYNFITQSDFEEKIASGFFLEWSKAYQDYYGSSREDIEKILQKGVSVILVIDRNGALQILEKGIEAYIIMIMTPNDEVLRERLQKRGTETPDKIAFRIQQSQKELLEEKKNKISHRTVINDSIGAAVASIASVFNDVLRGDF